MKFLLSGVLLLFAAMAGFGFLASFEGGPDALPFRFFYGLVGIACIGGIVVLFQKDSEQS